MLGVQEFIVILLIVVMVFGAKRIPEIMGGLGKGIRSFKNAMEDDQGLKAEQHAPPGEDRAAGAIPRPVLTGTQEGGASK